MAKKKSSNFLPEYIKTDKNKKFLASTFDQLIQTPELERLDGYVGSKLTPTFNPQTDFYLQEQSKLRKTYPLEPALVLKNSSGEVTDVVSFDDLLNELETYKSSTANLDSILRSKYYSYDPYIDWDKLINYFDYYWMPQGPEPILIDEVGIDVDIDIVGTVHFTLPYTYLNEAGSLTYYELSNGMKIEFGTNVTPASYHNNIYYVEGVGENIRLINLKLLENNEGLAEIYNETFDSDGLDEFPFDGDRRLPLNPEYITINRGSKDLNSWSRYNRWFHKDIIKVSSEINNISAEYNFNYRAKRPIVEFRANIKLYNHGEIGLQNIDVIDNDTADALSIVNGSYGYFVDNVILKSGYRVVFNADPNHRDTIFTVSYTTGTTSTLILSTASIISTSSINVSVNFGDANGGTSWYFDINSQSWKLAQQHTKINQFPLFDIFDNNGVSYSNTNTYQTNFSGTAVFGYDVGNGSNDTVLGFPLKFQNSSGIGSFLFKNYFMTDTFNIKENNASNSKSVSVTYLKNYETNSYFNVWQELTDYRLPIVEIQTISAVTNSLEVKSLEKPLDVANLSNIKVYKNNKVLQSTFTATSTGAFITLAESLPIDTTIAIKILTLQEPNELGYYEPPLSLSNNPLNGPVSDFTLSELNDHLNTMLDDISDPYYDGTNLRDTVGFTRYGSRIVVNANPISFTKLFLGKKEHNVVDALRKVGNNYIQYKNNFLRKINEVSYDEIPYQAVDRIINEINITKDFQSSFYRSDMLAYGDNKTIVSYTVNNPATVDYPIGVDFNLTNLSFKSVLIYLNNVQCIYGKDYFLNVDEVQFNVSLSLNDVIEIHVYQNTLGCFVPPTPTKLGLYPKYQPETFVDNTFVDSPVNMIRGHDGSIMVAYGDYRDALILEFEKRIYNNIKIQFDSSIYDVRAGIPGAYRDRSKFKPAIDIVNQDFSYWAGINNVDISSHSVYDSNNEFTWNYRDSIDVIYEEPVPKFWRGIYNYFYDTDSPHVRPWEILGFSVKPAWWDTNYSWTNLGQRASLITAIEQGKVSDPSDPDEFNLYYAKPNFGSIVPVDTSGNLLNPLTLVTYNNVSYRSEHWEYGDGAPAENAWKNTSYWPYAVNIISLLLNPLDYLSTMFDTSRLSLNILNQITYTEDDLYLNPKKIVLDGENNFQSSGYSVLVIEAGKIKNQNYISQLREDLDYLNFNLFHKLGGFSSKEKLQINIDSVDPVSTSPGLVLPYEDYNIILNTSNPVNVSSASGIIIQKVNGKFVIKGYDLDKPYFDVLLPQKESFSPALTIGGISEDFTEWSGIIQNQNRKLSNSETATAKVSPTTRFYKSGQIVRYNNKFYRCKISHNPSASFDVNYWASMTSLPIKGGITVETAKKFSSQPTRYVYGYIVSTIQEMYDIIVGYGAYLEKQGWVFDAYTTKLSEVMNWKYAAKEFLFWCTQNWAENNLITLSPFADSVKFSFQNSVVENIKDSRYEYSLLKADGKPFPIDKFSLIREDGFCTLTTKDTEEGFFFVKFISVQKEHALVFNNTTVFNDIIYDIETGYKQLRIKLSGFRTKDWNGDLYSPGFVYDNFTISDWVSYREYKVGDVVRFNGSYYQANRQIESSSSFIFDNWSLLSEKPVPDLLPNFDYKISQFEDFYSLDIDNFDNSQQKLAQHLIGYTPRNYFNNIFTNPISQYKFYQGFIKDKGTKNALDKLSKASRYQNKGEVTFNEEWAFRVGVYGGFSNYDEIEFPLVEGTSLENPYLIKFVDETPLDVSPLINYVTPSNLLLSTVDYNSTSVFSVIQPENTIVPNSTSTAAASEPSGTYNETGIVLSTAGYVRLDEVTATAYNKNSLLDIARNGQIQNKSTVWTGFLENGQWSVYRYVKKKSKITGVYVSQPGQAITFSCNLHHFLNVGDIVSIVNFNEQVNGVYIIDSIPSISQFTVKSTLASIVNEEQLSYGNLFVFETVRYSTLNSLVDKKELLDLDQGELFWVDSGVSNKWQVYEKTTDYGIEYINSANSPSAQELGHTIWANESTDKFFIAAPNFNTSGTFSYGRLKVYERGSTVSSKLFEYTLNSFDIIYANPNKPTEFGYSIQYDTNKNYIIVGAPKASNIKGITGLEQEPSNVTYNIDILVSNTATVQSASGVAVSSNGFIVSPEEVTYTMSLSATTSSVTMTAGTFTQSTRIFDDEGIVKISSVGQYNDEEQVEAIITNPLGYYSTASNKVRFGHSIYINEVATASSTLMLISAPGTEYVGNSLYVYPNIVTWSMTTSTGSTSSIIQSYTSSVTTGTIGNVFAYRLRKSDGIQISVPSSGIVVESTNTVNLSVGDLWGYKISGNSTGTYLAISAPSYSDSTSSGVVQVFRYANNSIFHNQTIYSPYGAVGEFGKEHLISYTGKFLIISAPEYRNLDTSYGSVTVYRLGNNRRYSRLQTIRNPINGSDLKFGHSLSLNKNEDKLLISGLGTNRSIEIKFDVSNQSTETVFDNGTTHFIETVPDSGTVYAYQKLGDYFVAAHEISDSNVLEGSKYGFDVVSTNRYSYVGAPFGKTTSGADNSSVHIFDMPSIFSVKHEQPNLVDVSAIERVALIDSYNEEVSEYLEIIDPLKGKISGLAEQELKYKSPSDPAIYSIGRLGNIVDDENNWLDDHVGELWWDLSTLKYVWYEQGDDTFRKNNWGKLFPGSTIDVYEWVRSDLLPSAWAALADTNAGVTDGISGQPKYPANDVISVKQIYNSVTGNFENVYYFWVKNKLLLPKTKNRRLTAYQVASYIADPQAQGIKFAEFLSADSIAFANVQPLLIDNRITANISFNNQNQIPRHTEWLLLTEGSENSVPNTLLEKKLIDSLLGEDINGNPVPDPTLSYRNRYGLGVRPQQTIFKNRNEALRNIIQFTNNILEKEQIVGRYSLDTLSLKDEIPTLSTGKYDISIDSISELTSIDTSILIQGQLSCDVSNGKIVQVSIINRGYGYRTAPEIYIGDGNNSAILKSSIDELGRIVSIIIENAGNQFVTTPTLKVRPFTVLLTSNVEDGGRWTLHEYNNSNDVWIKVYTQKYRTEDYWAYIDWSAEKYDQYRIISYVVDIITDLSLYSDIVNGLYIKVNNNGTGKYIIVEKVENNGNLTSFFDLVYVEDGTIQISDAVWNENTSLDNYDISGLADNLYDQSNTIELRNILTALKNDIFVGELKVNWNLLFFASVRYALTEQKLLDWAFKTSFINVVMDLGLLDQRPVYKLDNEQYFEDYIKEIKPYHTQIRNYNSKYNSIDYYTGNFTDFDLPTYYNSTSNNYTPVYILASTSASIFTVTNTLTNVYPWKHWTDHYTYYVKEILVADGGLGYTQQPIVTLNTVNGDWGSGAAAVAFIRSGKVYKIIVTSSGSGYTQAPIITLTGGGPNVTIPATASVVLGNDEVRKNKIGIKFDRISKNVEILDVDVVDKFECDGEQNSFVLTWLANPDKSTIVPTIDGKLIFATDYRLEYFSQDYEGYYSKEFTKITLLNKVPLAGQQFKIIYRKNIKLLSAVDRIEQFYAPTTQMLPKDVTNLVSGLDYPLTTYQGMMFDDTAPWGTTYYDTAPWDDIVSELTRVKLLEDLYTTSTIIKVNTLTGITTGQSIVIGNTSTIKIRPETVVTFINSLTNEVTISSPTYNIKKVVSTDTTVGSVITFTTKEQFRGDIKVGDKVQITGVIQSGFNNIYTVTTTTNNTFQVNSVQVLASTSSTFATPAQARILSVLTTVSSTASVLDRVIQSSTGTATLQVQTYAIYSQMATATVSFSSGSPTWYITTSTGSLHRAVVNITGINPSVVTTSTINIYGYTDIEFWKYNLDPTQITVNLDGGAYQNGLKTTALGITATDNIVQGGGWIKPVGQYYGQRLNTIVEGTTASVYAEQIDKWYLRYLYRHADQSGLDYWVSATVSGALTLGDVENYIKTSSESTQIQPSFNPDGLINPYRSYSPEEFVPGDTKDSLSMSVYTRPETISPIMFNGVIHNIPGQETTATLSLATDDVPAGLLVSFNGRPLSRDYSYPFDNGLDLNAYVLEGNKITIAAQSVQGKISYSYVTAGAQYILDSKFVNVDSTTTSSALVISNMPYNGVGNVYVSLDFDRIYQYTTSSQTGYILQPVGNTNKRAAVNVQSIPPGRHELVAFFFRSRSTTFNKVYEEYQTITVPTTQIPIGKLPFTLEPISTQVIIEIIDSLSYYGNRQRLLPPETSYYKVSGNQKTFDINNKRSGRIYNNQNVKVYINGYEIRPGFDFVINSNETITIIQNIVSDGDLIAIMDLVDYDYVVLNGYAYFKNTLTSGIFKITHFTSHDNMGIRTERFDVSHNNEYYLSLPLINENYVWVTVDDLSLTAGYDFYIKPDLQTIVIGSSVAVTAGSDISIMTINPSNYYNNIVGFRLFKDIFDRQSFKRISKFYTTKLASPLNHFDDSVHVQDGSMLFAPNPNKNIPGVLFIDGERIEYFIKNGNELTQLRRGTFGTGVPLYSDVGTLVYDQSIKQNVYTQEDTLVQHIPSGYTATYIISTVTNTATFSINTNTHAGSGITLMTTSTHGYVPAFQDQIEVYYGNRKLRKQSLKVHYNERAYDTTSSVYYNEDTTSSYEILPPEFTVQVSTNQALLLNINEEIVPGTKITIVKKTGRVWDISTASVLVSTSTQAKFLRKGPAVLPSEFYYGGNLELVDENNNPLTEDDGDLLQGL